MAAKAPNRRCQSVRPSATQCDQRRLHDEEQEKQREYCGMDVDQGVGKRRPECARPEIRWAKADENLDQREQCDAGKQPVIVSLAIG